MNNQLRKIIYNQKLNAAFHLNILRTFVAEFIRNLLLNMYEL